MCRCALTPPLQTQCIFPISGPVETTMVEQSLGAAAVRLLYRPNCLLLMIIVFPFSVDFHDGDDAAVSSFFLESEASAVS